MITTNLKHYETRLKTEFSKNKMINTSLQTIDYHILSET